jgi:hypothetical protein
MNHELLNIIATGKKYNEQWKTEQNNENHIIMKHLRKRKKLIDKAPYELRISTYGLWYQLENVPIRQENLGVSRDGITKLFKLKYHLLLCNGQFDNHPIANNILLYYYLSIMSYLMNHFFAIK